jgi:predicted PurR-regulated permease PerM
VKLKFEKLQSNRLLRKNIYIYIHNPLRKLSMENQITTKNFYDIMIRLAFLALIIAWSLMILFPFTSIMLWGLILALALFPMHKSISAKLGGKPVLASWIIVLSGLIIIIVPSWLFIGSIVEGAKELKTNFDAGTLTIPPPAENVKSWPLIGGPVYALWNSASVSLKETMLQHQEQLVGIGKKLIQGLMSVGGGVAQMIISLIIAGVLMVTAGAGESIRKFFRKIAGKKGDEFADIANKTIGNVVKGVLGVAVIQSFLIGIGFLLAGVPYAGLWTLIVLMLAILQIPPTLVVIPVIIYLFSLIDTVPAILWSVYLMAGGISDNILKPILLGKGAPVPMLVIFLGVIGGFMFSGFIGLFTGAIVVSLAYTMFSGWINDPDPEN